MTPPATCGQGLAEHAALHSRLSALLAAVARNLELHLTSIDPADARSRPEHDAYTELAGEHRDLEQRLSALAERMAAQRSLPMAEHDPGVLGGPDVLRAFEELIRREEELVALLQGWIATERAMLAEFSGPAGHEQSS